MAAGMATLRALTPKTSRRDRARTRRGSCTVCARSPRVTAFRSRPTAPARCGDSSSARSRCARSPTPRRRDVERFKRFFHAALRSRRLSRAVGVRGGVHVVGAHGRRRRRNARPPRRRDGVGGMNALATALAAVAALLRDVASPRAAATVGAPIAPASTLPTTLDSRVCLSARARERRRVSASPCRVQSVDARGGSADGARRLAGARAWRIERDGTSRSRGAARRRAARCGPRARVRAQPVESALLSLDGIAVSRRARVRRLGQRARRRSTRCRSTTICAAWCRSRSGDRPTGDSAAVQAQAVTARSYAYIHLHDRRASYDVTGGVLDQVYGGVAAETPSRPRPWSRRGARAHVRAAAW